jgi:hypothetical protein
MNNSKIAAILIAAIASSVHSQEIRDVEAHEKLHAADTAKRQTAIYDDTPGYAHSIWELVCKQRNYERTKPENSANNFLSKENLGSSFITNIITGVLGIAAIIGLFLTGNLIRITRANGNRQLRAYVGYISLIPLDNDLCFTAKNFGNTPATDTTITIRPQRSPATLDEILSFLPNEMASSETIFPGGMANANIENWVTERPIRPFICGIIRYQDAFGERRITTFQYVMESGGRVRSHAVGNTTT